MTRLRGRIAHFFGPTGLWNTLRFRFALWVAGLLLVTLIVFGAAVYLILRHTTLNTVDDTLRLNAVQISAQLSTRADPLDLDADTDYSGISGGLEDENLTVHVVSLEGTVVYAFGPHAPLEANPELLASGRNGQDAYITVPDPYEDDDNMRLYAAPVMREGAAVGVVQVGQSLDVVGDTLEQLLLLLEIGIPLAVIVAGAGGYWLAARALARIDRITETARSISAKELSARLDLPATHDEVGRLAATFDMMLARLEGAFQRERQFTSDASHELRTPLAAMRTILEMTRSKRRSVADYETALDDLAEEAARLQTLVEDLLRLARQETNGTAVYEPIDLSELLDDIADSMRPLGENKGLTLTSAVPEGLVFAGDRDGLIRLFVNLVDNAIKATAAGEITLAGAREMENGLVITVADTGCGIDAEHLPHIFDRFYRVDASRSRGGAGLGLAIARQIVEAHGGRIEVSSEVGQGSTFQVVFPG